MQVKSGKRMLRVKKVTSLIHFVISRARKRGFKCNNKKRKVIVSFLLLNYFDTTESQIPRELVLEEEKKDNCLLFALQ